MTKKQPEMVTKGPQVFITRIDNQASQRIQN